MRRSLTLQLCFVFLLVAQAASGAEPNETFAQATVLPSGQLSVSDELGQPIFPDTILGAFGGLFGGTLLDADDDSSPRGNGLASAFYGVPISTNGVLSFVVSGLGDIDFDGFHSQSGDYVAYVTVYDFFDDEVDEFTVDGTLSPGFADSYSFNDFEYINGSYDVEIDNAVGGSDVDFFTFTGLTPGASFSAETFDTSSGVLDTFMGWFDDSGSVVETDDDGGSQSGMSRIDGVVPASGNLTFSVTGFGDGSFDGSHAQVGGYDLTLTIEGGDIPGDFDGDGDVDVDDFGVFANSFLLSPQGGPPFAPGDFNEDGDVDVDDFGVFANSFLIYPPEPMAIPEPGGAAMLFAAACASLGNGRRSGSRARRPIRVG